MASAKPTQIELPPLALSVRQPWAWAIIHGGKVIENRSVGSVRSGGMDCRTIALHAATGLTEKEYRWGYDKLREHGVACPEPASLPRGAIIGMVTVVDIIAESDSPWFGKSRPDNRGLVLENPIACAPIPSKGALGYFTWHESGALAEPLAWMRKYDTLNATTDQPPLFADAQLQFKTKPEKPY